MRIYSMKATFGKLEHQVLTLEPGLNIIEAPNEWGKSTWCAFLISMLYGIDTKSKTTRYQLADKERYLPWSGAPMEGRMDLHWNGRDITVERRSKGRIPLGDFRAYETHTGLEVPELTAENCGYRLLGVEKDVFTRSGFLRFSDLPVTEDEQLRSRLNALVTTGDESGNGELLEQKLKELKNRCRYNKSGLIPQLRLRKESIEQQLMERQSLDQQLQQLQEQVGALKKQIRLLKNHQVALRHRAAQERSALIQEAKIARDAAQQQFESLQKQIQIAPSRDTALTNIQELTQLQENLAAIQIEEQLLPHTAEMPQLPQGFNGCTAHQAVMQACRHRDELEDLQSKRKLLTSVSIFMGVFLLLFATFLLIFHYSIWSVVCGSFGVGYVILGIITHRNAKKRQWLYQKRLTELTLLYGSNKPDAWVAAAEAYAKEWESYTNNDTGCAQLRSLLRSRSEALVAKSRMLTQGKGLGEALEYWNDILTLWNRYHDAHCDYEQANKQYQNLLLLATDTPAPSEEDTLSYTEKQTEALLAAASTELGQLLSKAGHYRGYADSLGSREALEHENAVLEQRLLQLEQTYAALDFAQKALAEATSQLQRRFAPRISRSAQEILSQLTNERYTRLTLSQDFSLHAGAQDEEVLRSRHWRSDGTVDQLYFALRLAVARELIPEAPLVLDDAMVRFDDTRLQSALDILKQEAHSKQVIIFTCQSREQELLAQQSNHEYQSNQL